MRFISSQEIIDAVSSLCASANYELPKDVLNAIEAALKNEEAALAKDILSDILKNAQIAKSCGIPLCQDTGTANVFVKLGRGLAVQDGSIYDAINKGIADGYKNNYLRKSIVSDPLERQNSKDNTPPIISIDFVEGENMQISILPKGGGCDNASALKMLNPSDGWEGIKRFVAEAVKSKGANACPPLILGIGIGGDFSSVGALAKKALLREIGSENLDTPYYYKEGELLKEINRLEIGPMGLGGKTTALAVFIEARPCHIASLPVAVNFECHSFRRKTAVL